jgi:hypothetical protein
MGDGEDSPPVDVFLDKLISNNVTFTARKLTPKASLTNIIALGCYYDTT